MPLMTPQYQDSYYIGRIEELARNIDAFNEASNGTLLLASESYWGDYDQYSDYNRIAGLVRHRDVNSDAAVAAKRMSLNEHVGVDKAYGVGPVFVTDEEFARRGRPLTEAFEALGKQTAEELVENYLDNLIAGLVAATSGVAALVNASGAAATATYKSLLAADRLFGDQYKNVRAYVMNSDAFFDIAGDNLENYKMDTVAGVTIQTGLGGGALGKPIIVIDSPALNFDDAGTNRNRILALTTGAGSTVERAGTRLVTQDAVGQENLGFNWQTETNTMIKLKGYSWDIANGGMNPTDAALTTAGNWDIVIDPKLAAASMVITLGS